MKKSPLVSVIMPVYNNEAYLRDSIGSILKQTYKNFELLILSAENTNAESLTIIRSFNDPRIVHIRRDAQSAYIPVARNLGLDRSRGVYIAYMDSDDISLPHRLETEVAFMENRPDIAVAGSYAKTFGRNPGVLMRNPTKPEDIKANLLFHASMVNPTAIVRKETIALEKIRYDENLKYCEDLDFWVKASRKVKLATIPKVLLHYRTHDTQATHQEKDYQASIRDAIFQTQLDQFGVPAGDKKRSVYRAIRTFREENASVDFLSTAEAWFQDFARMNLERNIYEQKALKRVFANEWLALCRLSTQKLGTTAWRMFWRSEIRGWLKKDLRTDVRVIKFFFCSHL